MKTLLRRFLPAVLLLAVACLYTYKFEAEETHTYPAAGVTALSAATQDGGVSVTAAADTLFTVNVRKYAYGKDKADAEQSITNVVYTGAVVGTELQVKADMPSGPRPYGAAFTITAPETAAVSIQTTNGAITVSNAVGDVAAVTTNGAITLTGTDGTAVLATTNGALEVDVHRGGVDGKTTNGAVDCDLAALGPVEDVILQTTNGTVTLLLPADVSAIVDATNTGAAIAILGFTSVVYDVQEEHHVRARIGSGASSVTITTTNGSITVRARS